MMLFDAAENLQFFQKELTENLLSFWLPRCLDKENGGYLNCFTNDGSRLVSKDKYTWSQGRFLWTFSKLATLKSALFSKEERNAFLALAKNGRDFLIKHVLISPDDWRCVFLMEADGSPKYVEGYDQLDMSISADCFVVMGFAKYALAAEDRESFEFAKKLNDACVDASAQVYKAECPPAVLLKPPVISSEKVLGYICDKIEESLKTL